MPFLGLEKVIMRQLGIIRCSKRWMTALLSWHTGMGLKTWPASYPVKFVYKRMFTDELSSTFIYQLVSFVMVGFSLYGIAHIYTLVSHDPIIKFTKKCKYCRKRINEKVRSKH